MGFDKIYGAKERHDGLTKIGRDKYEARFGYGTDGENGYNYVCQYKGRKPSLDELKQEIIALVDNSTDQRILTGFKWNGKPVWMSMENQFNFKSIYDLAVQDNSILPVTFKLGEEEDGTVVYHTFEKLDDLEDFYKTGVEYVGQCLKEGWEEKDAIDWNKFVCDD